MRLTFRKTDLIIILGTAAAILALLLAFRANASAAAGEKTVRISVDGEVTGEYPLAEDRDIPVDTGHGHNLVRIAGGEVFMAEADCPDKHCINQGKIDGGARSIICLPHRVVVEVIGKDDDVDVVVE